MTNDTLLADTLQLTNDTLLFDTLKVTNDTLLAELSTFENGNEGDLPHRKMPMREIYRSVIFRHIFATCTYISNND